MFYWSSATESVVFLRQFKGKNRPEATCADLSPRSVTAVCVYFSPGHSSDKVRPPRSAQKSRNSGMLGQQGRTNGSKDSDRTNIDSRRSRTSHLWLKFYQQ